ncbi:hypothetical protein FGG08_004939 [Glutinoglossum americanum]|uniref:DUF803-domain-containing protein n=1 Tax=Glutinoglossum americanum TaxID=1670608 RepID=A0A9P8I4N4_9PEZI|nr:hypothetical protein FGG08_004939 [Glutinoglossum americanum]
MDATADLIFAANELYARSGTSNPNNTGRPPVYKAIGLSLAIASGVFIGISFVLKKKGLLAANIKYGEEAGEGYGYLRNVWWWTGMSLMILGEICNFIAYAFVDAILVTPLGALSVVITTILSAIFLNERLSFVGKVGCFICIIGSVIIVINAPGQSSAATIQEMQHFVIAPGFLSYAGVVIAGCTFIALWVAPRYGKKSMLVYLSVCSLIGGLSVVATQGLGAAVVAQAGGKKQFNQWFLYVLFAFVVGTLVTEIIYLNKALNLFNAALVTPTYYVFFTSSTIVTSAILFRGFKGSPGSIATIVMGFLQICSGVILLQLSKSAKDVSDVEIFKDDLDQVRTIAEQEQPESEPKADAIRGTAAIIRRISQARQKWEKDEAKRVFEDRKKDLLPIDESDGPAEWDGLRRRPTLVSRDGEVQSLQRRKTQHPPLGMTKFPDLEESQPEQNPEANWNIIGSFRKRAKSAWVPGQTKNLGGGSPNLTSSPLHPVPLTDISIPGYRGTNDPTPIATSFGALPHEAEGQHIYGLPVALRAQQVSPPTSSGGRPPNTQHSSGQSSGLSVRWASDNDQNKAIRSAPSLGSTLAPTPPARSAKRQFSFQNPFSRHKDTSPREEQRPSSRGGLGSRQGSKNSSAITEEEQLGLVKGDSRSMLALPDYMSDEEEAKTPLSPYSDKEDPQPQGLSSEKQAEYYEDQKRRRESKSGKETSEKAGDSSDERDEEREFKELEGRGRLGGGGDGGGGGSAFL